MFVCGRHHHNRGSPPEAAGPFLSLKLWLCHVSRVNRANIYYSSSFDIIHMIKRDNCIVLTRSSNSVADQMCPFQKAQRTAAEEAAQLAKSMMKASSCTCDFSNTLSDWLGGHVLYNITILSFLVWIRTENDVVIIKSLNLEILRWICSSLLTRPHGSSSSQSVPLWPWGCRTCHHGLRWIEVIRATNVKNVYAIHHIIYIQL